MRVELRRLLDHLEGTLDAARQGRAAEVFREALEWRAVARLPLVLTYPLPAEAGFRPYPYREAWVDAEKLLYNELVYAFESSIAARGLLDDDLPCTIRANLGTVIISSLFEATIEQIGDNPPWVRPLGSGDDTCRRILDCDPCDFSKGLCPRVIETYAFYSGVLEAYPNLRRCIRVVLPDLQGPFDTAEQLLGSGIYEDFYRGRERLFAVMRRAAEAQVGFAKRLRPYLNDGPEGFSHQHNAMIRGGILIRNDCAMNVSAAMYREQIGPHDAYVLEALGGGGIHCCGRCEHLVEAFAAVPGVRCIDFGQSEMNDMRAVYAKVRGGGVAIIRMRATAEELGDGRILQDFPTGVTLVCRAESPGQARDILKRYREDAAKGEAGGS